MFDGLPILAVFHSASGGRTASAAEVWGEDRPYLASLLVSDEDDSPATYWRVAVSRPTLRRALDRLGLGVGTVLDIEVAKRTPSGRVAELRVLGNRRAQNLTGRTLRDALGDSLVKSTFFEVRKESLGATGRGGEAGGFVIVGTGHGHGVGMSQWAARSMARRGSHYGEILRVFYPGARRETFPSKVLRRLARGDALRRAPAVSSNVAKEARSER